MHAVCLVLIGFESNELILIFVLLIDSEAAREAMKKADADSRLLLKSCLAGVGMALITIWHSTYMAFQRGKVFRAMLEQ